MSEYIDFGKATIYDNADATEENRRPNLSGKIEVTRTIPAGTKLKIAGWYNKQGSVIKSVGMNLSAKSDEVGVVESSNNAEPAQSTAKDEDIPF